MRGWLALPVALLMFSGCIDPLLPASTRLSIFPMDPIVRGSAVPMSLPNCTSLRETLNERALTQARVSLEQSVNQYQDYRRRIDLIDAGFAFAPSAQTASSAVEDGASPGGASARGASFTGTNNQESEAEEADLVKTDGEWTYVFSDGILHILHSEHVGDVREHANISFGPSWGAELLLERRNAADPKDDRLLLVLPGQQGPEGTATLDSSSGMRMEGQSTRVLVLSLVDRANPKIEHEAWIEGYSAGARLVDGVAYVVVHRWESDLGLDRWADPTQEDLRMRGYSHDTFANLAPIRQQEVVKSIALEDDEANQGLVKKATLADHLPVVLETKSGHLVRQALDASACRKVLVTEGSTGRGISTILSLQLDGRVIASAVTQVAGGRPVVYASGADLVLASPSQDAWWFYAQPDLEEATDLQWFELHGLNLRHRASGRVRGSILDSFALDVEGDELRVATTTGSRGRWWAEERQPMLSHVAVFQAVAEQLVLSGIVGGIAPEERIWSVRFTPERAYIVTFRQMDPLWVVDLRGTPEILGELEIPGVSTYIHPLDDDTLLTVGLAGGPDGQGLDRDNIQVSLFDVADPRKPRLADALAIAPGANHGWSGALHEHRAFTYWDAVGTLALPLTTHASQEGQRKTYSPWVSQYHVGLRLVNVDRDHLGLSLRGEVDQDRLLAGNEYGGVEIQRSYFLGYPETGPVSVYAVSPLGVTSHNFESLKPQHFVAFPRPPYEDERSGID